MSIVESKSPQKIKIHLKVFKKEEMKKSCRKKFTIFPLTKKSKNKRKIE